MIENPFKTFLKSVKGLEKAQINAVLDEERQGSVLDLFVMFSEQFSINFPDEISRKTRAPNV